MMRSLMMPLIALAVAVGAIMAAGCKKQPRGIAAVSGSVDTRVDPQVTELDRRHDLEATVLENYFQLTLGNIEAYADSLARDHDVVLIGVKPDDLIAGKNQRYRDLRLFESRAKPRCMEQTILVEDEDESPDAVSDPGGDPAAADVELPDGTACIAILPKKLELHLYRDFSVGWVSDEISYRVPFEGRIAAIPLRMTAVLIRDIDRWVVVMEHVSYALPRSQLIDQARKHHLARPAGMTAFYDDRGRERLLRTKLDRWLNADARAQGVYRAQIEAARKRGSGRDRYLLDAGVYLTLNPYREQSYRGMDARLAPSLAQAFGEGTRVAITSHRMSVAANKRVAWMAANLMVTTPAPDDPRTTMSIAMRGTFLFAFDASGWNIVHAHVSVPMTEDQLATHIFGAPLSVIEDSELAQTDDE